MSEHHIDFDVSGPNNSSFTTPIIATGSSNDPVNHPKHYTSSKRGIECIDAILACVDPYVTTPDLAWLVGQVIKYLWRAPLKGKMSEDLHKAQFYMNRIIKEIEK